INGLPAGFVDVGLGLVEGYCKVLPPRFSDITEFDWAGNRYVPDCQEPDCLSIDFGHLSLRHRREAAIAFFD
ncbi:MAG: hypothetical protein GTN86_05995, partial [Xanthomonadales bacterium]|nr:hypothetical protein [Xanthomonadales bacterium]NIQ35465.1 hypothetical protein [Xanthomonadales bacterium]